jgi:hypothetical protein
MSVSDRIIPSRAAPRGKISPVGVVGALRRRSMAFEAIPDGTVSETATLF